MLGAAGVRRRRSGSLCAGVLQSYMAYLALIFTLAQMDRLPPEMCISQFIVHLSLVLFCSLVLFYMYLFLRRGILSISWIFEVKFFLILTHITTWYWLSTSRSNQQVYLFSILDTNSNDLQTAKDTVVALIKVSWEGNIMTSIPSRQLNLA